MYIWELIEKLEEQRKMHGDHVKCLVPVTESDEYREVSSVTTESHSNNIMPYVVIE